MPSPAYDKFMAFANTLPLDSVTIAAIEAAGDVLHTEAVEEETQNVIRNLMLIRDEQVARNAPQSQIDITTITLDALTRLNDEFGNAFVANWRDAVTDWKSRRATP